MSNELLQLISSPYFWLIIKILLGYWLFSALVSPLPMPQAGGSGFYKYLFGVLHGFAGNLNRAATALKVPGAKETNGGNHAA